MADFEARKLDELDHRTDDASAPEVFFTSVITPESLIGAYHALGRKPQGNVAIKIHSGESEKSNNLNPALVKDLVQEPAARSSNVRPHTMAIAKRLRKALPCSRNVDTRISHRSKSWTWAVKSKFR
ncbi:MAG: hypothetical protein ACLSUZ_04330 [Bifidobacterium pseudocatenulatum]